MSTLLILARQLRTRDDAGQDLIEYALLVALIAIVTIAGVMTVGSTVINSFWSVIADGLTTPQ